MQYADAKTGRWVSSRSMIARRYVGGFFVVDFVSVLPFWLVDIVAQVDDDPNCDAPRDHRAR